MTGERTYRQCSISVMDTIADKDIVFDAKGISNYYYEYKKAEAEHVVTGEAGRKQLEAIAAEIKEAGKNQPYDCIMGLPMSSTGRSSGICSCLILKHQ